MLTNTAFRDVTFKSCKLIGIDWTKAKWPSLALTDVVAFDGCILDSGSFFGLRLKELKLEGCQARDVDFAEADLEQASFLQTDLENSTFHHTRLRGADFTDAANYTIDVFNNDITGATFSLPEAVRLLSSLDINVVE